MRSIRLSLVVYFLVLLAIALGAVGVVVYHITEQTLLARKETMRGQVRAQNENTRRLREDRQALRRDMLLAQQNDYASKEQQKLDEALLSEARTLASLASYQFQYSRTRFTSLLTLGLLTAGFSPNGYVLVPVWVGEGVRSPLAYRIQRGLAAEIQFKEEFLHSDEHVTQYFQINSEWGNIWRSQSMEGQTFRFNPNRFADKLLDWEADEPQLDNGRSVRRVVLKSPVARVSFPWGGSGAPFVSPPSPRAEPFVGPPAPSSPPAPPRFAERSSSVIFIHCAAETGPREAAIFEHGFATFQELDALEAEVKHESARLEDELTQELARVEAESTATLASLRNRLLLIGLVTFVLTVAGGFVLVRHGLAPLHRLSDAVSRVSVRDFRLQFDEERLPGELRPIVERLNETLELLKRAFAREKQAAADISHELRTPLAALLTTIDVALRKPRSPGEYRELLEDCRASGQQMNQLVEHLLTLARLDAGVDQLRPRHVDVSQLARQCAAVVRPLAEARGLSLAVQCADATDLTADPDKLREVLTNLLHNAIEYNRPHGSVELRIERDNGHLRLEVRDSGIGIAPEVREHIFERFYRADPSRQSDGLHAGLGLSIVKGYIDLMGGSLAVESEPGQGSTFRVTLPA